MCGIAGIFDIDNRSNISEQLISAMTNTLEHRGPDGFGLYRDPGIAIGHRRLAIIDVNGGHQPLGNEDDSVQVVFNGEIYNYRDLMSELMSLGHRFKTKCDTEVIVHAWEQWGPKCVSRFRGMFAFAVWDSNKQTLFLARDRMGVKPLYYAYTDDGRFIFGSEFKCLLEYPGLSRQLNPHAVSDYFTVGYVPDPMTIYTGAKKLAPGHALLLEKGTGTRTPKPYWDVVFSTRESESIQETTDGLLAQLRDAINIRMESEVPLGAFLSGGVDSSAVVALMSETTSEPVTTCSISFEDAAFNEEEYSKIVAEQYATNHKSETVQSKSYGLIDSLANIFDEPFADSSALPTYRVCELARKYVTVAISGDGGDESFAGYRRHRMHVAEERIKSMLPDFLRVPIFGLLGSLYPKADWAPQIFRAKTTFQALAMNASDAYLHAVSIISKEDRSRLLSESIKKQVADRSIADLFRQHATQSDTEDPLSIIQYIDYKTYLTGDINTKVDRTSMAHSLEVREPLMDHELVEYAAGIASSLKLQGGEGKWILKKALEPLLPSTVLYRPKMGFSIPLSGWLRGPLRKSLSNLLTSEVLLDSRVLNMSTLERMIDLHSSSRRDYSAALWSVIMFDAFLRRVHRPC